MNLLFVDTASVQPYIFASNRLRENIGASELVARATGRWALEALPKPNNVRDVERCVLDDSRRLEGTDALQAEVIYVGGGNAMVLVRDDRKAREFVSTLSRRVVTDAPGLNVVIGSVSFDWAQSLVDATREAMKASDRKKRQGGGQSPLLGLGVTAACSSTGLPAAAYAAGDDGRRRPVSAEVLAKIGAAKLASERLRYQLGEPAGYAYPERMDLLGRSRGEASYVAVVHVDANDMGQRIQALSEEVNAPDRNREYGIRLREFSRALERAAVAALEATISDLRDCIADGKIAHPTAGRVVPPIVLERASNGQYYLPFRPIVYGGDDVTFVCDGRLAPALAVAYLEHFERESAQLPDGKGKATASAGVAIVKSHYPFARAYALSDELCSAAKRYRRETDYNGSALDWHLATAGLAGTLGDVRRREYIVARDGRQDHLTLRPLTLAPNAQSGMRNWQVVRRAIAAFQTPQGDGDVGSSWIERRNKVKALREALRDGGEAVREFRILFNGGERLPDLGTGDRTVREQGWQGDRCGYFDAIEAADWFMPLALEGQ